MIFLCSGYTQAAVLASSQLIPQLRISTPRQAVALFYWTVTLLLNSVGFRLSIFDMLTGLLIILLLVFTILSIPPHPEEQGRTLAWCRKYQRFLYPSVPITWFCLSVGWIIQHYYLDKHFKLGEGVVTRFLWTIGFIHNFNASTALSTPMIIFALASHLLQNRAAEGKRTSIFFINVFLLVVIAFLVEDSQSRRLTTTNPHWALEMVGASFSLARLSSMLIGYL